MPTKLDPDANVATKPEVKADPGLLKIYAGYSKIDEQFAELGKKRDGLFITVIDYVKKEKLSRAVVAETLKARGLSESSIGSELSRIFKFASEAPRAVETYTKLKAGEISIADARKQIAKPQENKYVPPAPTVLEKVTKHMLSAAKLAIDDVNSEKGEKHFEGIKVFTDVAVAAWEQYQTEIAQKLAEKLAKKQGPAAKDEDDDSPAVSEDEESSVEDGELAAVE